jgi:serine phosphatase RsbU (regulator of sigma subunit)
MGHALLIQFPGSDIRRLALEGERYTLGRAHDNDLCYPEDASLSRWHLAFEKDSLGWSVTDLGSKNGTSVNGARIPDRRRLQPRDRLAAGSISMTFIDSQEATPTPRVEFVTGAISEPHTSTVVVTSLEGVMSGERSMPPGSQPGGFDSLVVRSLVRAGREIAQDRPLPELFQLVLELSIDTVRAERGVLMTLHDEQLVPQAYHGQDFRISQTVRDRVIRERASVLVRNTQQDEWLRGQASIYQQQIRSLMAVPLQTEDQVLGLVYVDSASPLREFAPDDLSLLTVLANMAAFRIEQERYRQLRLTEESRSRDLEQAAEIQRGILPRKVPAIGGLDLAGYNAACRTVGGDYYDFIEYADGRLALVVADAAGKGISAALLMSNLQASVRILAPERSDPAALVSRLNGSLVASTPSNRFVSLFACLLDPASGRLLYCNAGHNPTLLVRAGGALTRLEPSGPVLGIIGELQYSQHIEQLGPGDVLVLYSDGITEATDPQGEEFGQPRLEQIVTEHRQRPAAEIVQCVNGALREFTAAAPPSDDITLVIVRCEEPARETTAPA